MALVSTVNSSNVPLGGGGVFTGSFVEVKDFAAISVLLHSDRASATGGLKLDWSTDGVNTDDAQEFNYAGSASQLGLTVYASVRSRFFRIRYVNSGLAQAFMRLQTMLHDKTPQGSIGYLGQPVTINEDTLLVKAVLAARDITSGTAVVLPFASADPFLIVEHPPNRNTQIERTVSAAVGFSQQLDFFGLFGGSRRHMSIFNDTIRGHLFVRFVSSASLSTWTVKLPPQHWWDLPQSWGYFSGTVHGIWDVADGSAQIVEWF